MADLEDNFKRVRERIARACDRAGRAPGDVTLVAVTKTVPAALVRQARDLGATDIGENRVQEAQSKAGTLEPLGLRWHLIGHLQRNKAKYVPGLFDRVHSLDSAELARELEKRCAAAGLRLPCLVEVNIAGEAQKNGVAPGALGPLLAEARDCAHLAVDGLMTMTPAGAGERERRRIFGSLRDLAERHGLRELSMGMTDDFEIAIEEGTTMVRVGRAIFGERA